MDSLCSSLPFEFSCYEDRQSKEILPLERLPQGKTSQLGDPESRNSKIVLSVTALDIQPTHQIGFDNPVFKMSLKYEQAHGFLMWVSMGFLMPIAIILIRMSKTASKQGSAKKLKILFYLHVVIQTLAVAIATAGAIISLMKFHTKFRYTHQRLGLTLYIIVWLQPIVGFLRPKRGMKGRTIWYSVHWILGVGGVILGIVNTYIGIHAYEVMNSSSIRTLNILFSIEVSVIGAFYLIKDRWDYLLQQGVLSSQSVVPALGNDQKPQTSAPITNDTKDQSPCV
eukprot:Gb_09965 [translate_table: standard]